MPADSMAMSLPVAMAMPISAVTRAGASLIPSPAMATFRPLACSSRIFSAFSVGRTSAMTSSMPTCLAMWAAAR